MDGNYDNFQNDIQRFVDDIEVDILGNIIAHKKGEGRRIMLIAHHDVVCLMITYIDSDGFLFVKPAGGIDISILPAREIVIRHEEKSVIGIIGRKPIHLLREDQNVKVTYDNLWVDIGAKNKEEAERMVSIGDYAYFCSDLERLPNNLIVGSYFDDCLGLKVLSDVAKDIYDISVPWDIYFVASNYEEIGMRGACVAANSIKPDVCICIDATHATDYPTMNVISDGDIKLGEGCVIAKGPNILPDLFTHLKDIADKHEIKYQVEVSPYQTGTDANIIQLSGIGVKTAVISIPCRYMHTPYEVVCSTDIDSATSLVSAFINGM